MNFFRVRIKGEQWERVTPVFQSVGDEFCVHIIAIQRQDMASGEKLLYQIGEFIETVPSVEITKKTTAKEKIF